MQAIINGEMYEVEPAVKVIIDNLMIENARLKKENARLEELYQKSVGVIAATDCVECKNKPAKHGRWNGVGKVFSDEWTCSNCGHIKGQGSGIDFCGNCGAKMDGGEKK
jgi:rubrerythrin